ncbi:hypothetical protein ENUP19_0173G0004 [Entamoeba nuttalli]|uniref:RING-type domain-containing protein n=1 Tax=Entamoeba nuttalli TaxID=412467 RepID=A0ABQ0DL51_9EUKA
MGICFECKKPTDLYCVHHKKHICIECIFKNHINCTVCKYREYVEENREEVNNCIICSTELTSKETVRLPCFCVFHKDCLISLFDQSIEEVKCPKCHQPIFTQQDIPNQIKDQLISTFAGKSYLQPFLELNPPKHEEEIDMNAAVLLNETPKEVEQQPQEKEEQDNVEYVQQEITSLKRKDEKIEGSENNEVAPTIEFDMSSDEDDHGNKKKEMSSIGKNFIQTLGKKNKISGSTLLILFGLMILLVVFMVVVYFIGNKDT